MKRLFAAAFVLLAAPVAAGPEQVEGVYYDQFTAPLAADFTLTNGCGGGEWTVSPAGADWFEYIERDIANAFDGVHQAAGTPEGYFDTGCGLARVTVPVPAGNEHLHVRFTADREVVRATNTVPVNLIQQVNLYRPDGTQIVSVPYVETSDEGFEPTRFDLEPIQVPTSISEVIIEWYFEDPGSLVTQETFSVLSGAAFRSRVSNINLEFSDIPVVSEVSSDTVRHGNLRQETVTVVAEVPDKPGTAVRVFAAPELEFSHVVLPDGTTLRAVGSIGDRQIPGFDLDRVLLEQTTRYTQVTVPAALTEEHGPGTYSIVFTNIDAVEYSPLLIPFAVLLFALPVPFAALAYLKTRSYEREAFGAYRRSARNLRYGVIVVFAFYAVVLASAFISGRLDLTTVWPLPLEGWLQYIQVAVAIGAFSMLWLVARQLEAITKPAPDV